MVSNLFISKNILFYKNIKEITYLLDPFYILSHIFFNKNLDITNMTRLELHNIQNEVDSSFRSTTEVKEIKSIQKNSSKWKRKAKLLIKDLSNEYQYEFFIRFGLQMFLLIWVMSLLSIWDFTFKSANQILSFLISVLIIVRNRS